MANDHVDASLIAVLGRPSQDWPIGIEPLRRVLRMPGIPAPGFSLYATVGLSDRPFPQKGNPPVRHELVVVTGDSTNAREVVPVLGTISREVHERGLAVERGEVFGPNGPIFEGSELTSFFATVPVYLSNDGLISIPGGGTVLLVWLLPLTTTEANLARQEGPRAFEDRLEHMQQHANLFDWNRGSSRS